MTHRNLHSSGLRADHRHTCSVNHPHQHRPHHRGRLVRHAQLADAVLDVEVHGVFRQQQDFGDVLRRFAVGGPFQHLDFPLRQGAVPLDLLLQDQPGQQGVSHVGQPVQAVALGFQFMRVQGRVTPHQ